MARNLDRTWEVPPWKLAREYADIHGMQAAMNTFGTTGYTDEDKKLIDTMPVVKFAAPKQLVIPVPSIAASTPKPWTPRDGLAAREY